MTKIMCSTGSFWMWELPRTLGVIRSAGFESVELMVTGNSMTQSAEVAGAIAKKEGVVISAIHAPMLVVTRRVWGPSFRPIIEKSCDLAKALGSEIVVIHPPYYWEARYQTWLLNEVSEYSKKAGVTVAVENMFRLWIRGLPVRGHRWMSPDDLTAFDNVTLDTSHCGVDGFDILGAVDTLGDRIAHVHLSDSLGNRRDNHAFPGAGHLPLKDFLRRFRELNTTAAVSLEVGVRDLASDEAKLTEDLIRAREFCEEGLS